MLFRSERLRLGVGRPELVFSHADGSPMDPDSITKAFDRLIEPAGVRRITFHGFRRTHISHQLMDGMHVKIVSERAGHANVSTTLSVSQRSFRTCKLMRLLASVRGCAVHSLSKSLASRWQSAISRPGT